MKTLLNLLPEEKKEHIQSKLRFRFLLWQLFLLFTLEIFYLTILAGMYFILDFQIKSLHASLGKNSQTTQQAQEATLASFEQKFKETNQSVARVDKIERAHLNFTEIFLLLDTLIPPGITVSVLKTNEYTVSLVGKAEKREHLLALDANLKGSNCITNVNIPLSNLFSQENIDFQMNFSVKPECLKK